MKIFVSIFAVCLLALSISAQTEAEVIVPKTFLRKNPTPNAEIVQTVQKGDVVRIEKSKNDDNWYYVSAEQGRFKGWVSRNTVRPLAVAAADNPTQNPIQPETPPSAVQLPVAPPATAASPEPPAPTPAAVSTAPTPPPTTQPESPSPVAPSVPVASAPAAQPVAAAPAAQPEVFEDKEVLKVETEEVTLNVRVVDSNNRTVTNLNQAQFKIYEDETLQPISSFATSEVPVVNALLIDNSRSLRAQLGKIVEAGKILVSTNKPADQSAVVRFVSNDKIEVVQDFTTNKNLIGNALDNLFIEGGQTALFDAIYRTAKQVEAFQNSQKKEDVKIRALVLVSDGDDRASSYSEESLFELLRATQVQIYAIGFTNNLSSEIGADGKSRQEKARGFLNRLAQETGGKVYYPSSADELAQIAAEISTELRTQYSLSYSPTSEGKGTNFRRIKVTVEDGAGNEKRTAITRSGRTVSPK